jgi:hypothetical protein
MKVVVTKTLFASGACKYLYRFLFFFDKTKAISISASGGQGFHILSANSSCAEDPFRGLVPGRSSTIVSQPLHFVDEAQPTKIRIVKVTRPMLSGANDISSYEAYRG